MLRVTSANSVRGAVQGGRRGSSCTLLHARAAQPLHAARISRPRGNTTQAMMSTGTSSNPAFTMGRVQDAIYETGRGSRNDVMTVEGAMQKTGLLMAVAMIGAAYTWMQIYSGNSATAMAALATSRVAGMVGFGAALATMFKPHWAPVSGLIYAVAKGLAIGGMAAMMDLRYPGIVLNATMLTMGTAFSLFAAFQARLISVNDNFRNVVTMVTGGFMITMLGTWLLSLGGVQIPGLMSGGPLGIGIGLVSAGLAASNLLMDFDMIKSVARSRMPKWYEYYSAFSLLLTLVWMWTSILRLLSIMGGRDN